MFVTIILDTEYMGMGERHKWFLKNLSHGLENDWLVITHEHLGKYYHKYAQNCGERFYREFEMNRLHEEEYEKISKGFIPDKIFEEKEKTLGSRSELLMYLFQERDPELEQCLIQIIEKERRQRGGEKVEGIFNCLDCFASIKYLGSYYQCPVIPYVFSAIRKVHGYQQTLYMTSMDGNLYSSQEGSRRYQKFETEQKGGREQEPVVFSRRELLAIFGKEQNLPLLKLLNCTPEYEMGVCASGWNINHNFLKFKYTDDDIYYECKKVYREEQMITRTHPMKYDSMGVGREYFRNDPVSFFLRCKRITSVQSQMLLKAMLWNRAVYGKGDFLQFSFLCEKDLESTKKVSIASLNYYIFGFLIPEKLMFDLAYWRWRIKEKPTEHEIYRQHLKYYKDHFKWEDRCFECQKEEERFIYLLEKRSCTQELIQDLLEEKIPEHLNYEVLYSVLEVGTKDQILARLSCINSSLDGSVCSQFGITSESTIELLKFYPFVDIGGKAKICHFWIDSCDMFQEQEFQYYPKAGGYQEYTGLKLLPGKHVIEVEWEYSFR